MKFLEASHLIILVAPIISIFPSDCATTWPLNPPSSAANPVAEKAHRQAWSDAERKQICEYAVALYKLHSTRLSWKQIKSGWEDKNTDKVCLYVVNRITGCH